MGVQWLQSFSESAEGVAESVELTQLARNILNKSRPGKGKVPPKRLCLVLDAECCLDRLYGGYFSDWTCGGQWNRMIQFLEQLMITCRKANIEFTIAFNGSLEQQRLSEWVQRQTQYRQKVQMVLRHVQNKGTPPPKVWWVPPACLSTALRIALRYLNVNMVCSMDDHHQEVLAYCRENNLHGIVGDAAEYLVFDPPRYFSASNIKLTYKGFIETKEYFYQKLSTQLGLDTQGMCILTALLGNFHLPETQLATFYAKLKLNGSKEPAQVINSLAEYVKGLENTDTLDAVALEIFGSDNSDQALKRRQLFVKSVQYYLNGTKDGFLKYKPRKAPKKELALLDDESDSATTSDMVNSRFASETGDNQAGSLQSYSQPSAGAQSSTSQFLLSDVKLKFEVNGDHAVVNGTNGSSHSQSSSTKDGAKKGKTTRPPPEVLRTAGERHQKGIMSPLIYQILTQGEIRLPVLLEDSHQYEVSTIHNLYQPVRQSIYAILFNVHHQIYMASKEVGEEKERPELPVVKEWHFPYTEAVLVEAEPISWPVPTIQRLWFGTNIEDMRRRLRAYLTCMKSDSNLMLTAMYVPQHLLVMASVLRYLMQSPTPVLRQLELDAFIVTAFSPELRDQEYTQELHLSVVTGRGVYLATLFMQGVETAILANEACGAPIPFQMCSPWLYFDGKLFNHILAKTEYVKSLQELCNHRMDILVKVERMRHAILENLHVHYARRGINNVANSVLPYATGNMVPAGYNPGLERRQGGPTGNLRGNQRRTVSARGGQLEVAGVVVCSWGPNYSLARDRNPPIPPGGMGRGVMRNYYQGHGPSFPTRRRPNLPRRNKAKKQPDRRSTGRGIPDTSPDNNTGQSSSSGTSSSDESGEVTANADTTRNHNTDATS